MKADRRYLIVFGELLSSASAIHYRLPCFYLAHLAPFQRRGRVEVGGVRVEVGRGKLLVVLRRGDGSRLLFDMFSAAGNVAKLSLEAFHLLAERRRHVEEALERLGFRPARGEAALYNLLLAFSEATGRCRPPRGRPRAGEAWLDEALALAVCGRIEYLKSCEPVGGWRGVRVGAAIGDLEDLEPDGSTSKYPRACWRVSSQAIHIYSSKTGLSSVFWKAAAPRVGSCFGFDGARLALLNLDAALSAAERLYRRCRARAERRLERMMEALRVLQPAHQLLLHRKLRENAGDCWGGCQAERPLFRLYHLLARASALEALEASNVKVPVCSSPPRVGGFWRLRRARRLRFNTPIRLLLYDGAGPRWVESKTVIVSSPWPHRSLHVRVSGAAAVRVPLEPQTMSLANCISLLASAESMARIVRRLSRSIVGAEELAEAILSGDIVA